MKSIYSVFIFLLFVMTSYGKVALETSFSGKVVDEQGRPLEYVNIGVVATSAGTVSGLGGAFELHLKTDVQEDATIRFSMIGYATKSFPLKSFKSVLNERDGIIILEESSILLDAITVIPQFTESKTKGNTNTDANMMVKFAISKKPNQNLGSEIARKFLLPRNKQSHLEQMRFFINQNNFDTIRFRINIYELKNGKPARNLATKNIIKEVTDKQGGWITVDLRDYDLVLDARRIAVGVEWIYSGRKGSFLNLPITFPSIGATHFYKFGSQAKWKRFRGMSACIELSYAY